MTKNKNKVEEDREERCFAEEYKNWRKAVPFTYEMVMTHALHWPSQSFEWLETNPSDDCLKTKVLVSSVTGFDRSHLMTYDVYLPDSKFHFEDYQSKLNENSNRDKNEPFGVYKTGLGKFVAQQRIVIGGKSVNAVNNVRYVVNDCVLVSTYSKSKDNYDLVMYDMRRDGWAVDMETDDLTALSEDEARPVARFRGFTGHQFEIKKQENDYFVVGPGSNEGESELGNKNVNIWSLEKAKQDYIVHPIVKLGTGSLDGCPSVPVNDVAWWKSRETCIVAAKEGQIMLWDLRAKDRSSRPLLNFSVGDSRSGETMVAPSPFSNFVIASGSVGERPVLWDLRNCDRRLHTLGLPGFQQKNGMYRLRWSPHYENLLACSTDSDSNKIVIYDLSILSNEEKMRQGRSRIINGIKGLDIPELVFSHNGHSASITDFNWHPQIPGLLGSCALDNVVQLWKPLENIVPLKNLMKQEEVKTEQVEMKEKE